MWRIQKSLNQQKSFCIFRKSKKKILQLGEIVFWIEHSIMLFFFPFSVFWGGLVFPCPAECLFEIKDYTT